MQDCVLLDSVVGDNASSNWDQWTVPDNDWVQQEVAIVDADVLIDMPSIVVESAVRVDLMFPCVE